MGLTKAQAIDRLNSVNTVEELRNLIRQLDTTGSNGQTVFWSGTAGEYGKQTKTQIYAQDIVESLQKVNPGFRTLGLTEAGQFLNLSRDSEHFNQHLDNKLKSIFNNNQEQISDFLYGMVDPATKLRQPTGVWDDISLKFANETKGDVRLMVGGARLDRVFAQTELLALLNNPQVRTIEGIPRESLKLLERKESIVSVFRLLSGVSEVTTGMIRIQVDEIGRPILNIDGTYNIDPTDYVNMKSSNKPLAQGVLPIMDFIPEKRKVRQAMAVREIYQIHPIMQLQGYFPPRMIDPRGLPSILARVGNYAGVAGDVLSVGTMVHKSSIEMINGHHEAAHDTVVTWTFETVGGLLAGRLATALVAPLMMTGPIGFVVGAGIIIAASVGGGEIGKKLIRKRRGDVNDFVQDIYQIGSPLILDLDGNGIETLALDKTILYFDHDNNNFVEKTGWVAPNDGLLILDLNGNGIVDGGAELFGNFTVMDDGACAANGFIALSMYDNNADKRIDQYDAIWKELRVWRDQNSNAQTDPGEWFSLADLQIKSLLLTNESEEIMDANGNLHLQHGLYERLNGQRLSMTDVWFAKDTINSIPTVYRDVDEETAKLPDVPGIGSLPSLHQALMDPNNPSLKPTLLQWLQATRQQRIRLSEELLFQWCDASNNPFYSPDRFIWSDDPKIDLKLAVVEKMMGDQLVTSEFVLGTNRSEMVRELSDEMTLNLDMLLHHEIAIKPLFELAVPVESDLFGPLQLDLTASLNHLRSQFLKDPDPGYLPMIQWLLLHDENIGQTFFRELKNLSATMPDPLSRAMRLQREHTEPWQWIRGTPDLEHLKGTPQNDFIEAGPGSDTLWGSDGDDTLHGGTGSDICYGGNGGDTYIVIHNKRVFTTTISDQGSETRGLPDRVVFWDFASHELRPLLEGDQLVFYPQQLIKIGENYYKDLPVAMIKNHENPRNQIEEFHFADGVVWSYEHVLSMIQPQGTPGHDQLTGVRLRPNRLQGLAGNDTLIGGFLPDLLDGGDGHDVLTGSGGSDTLIGGPGLDFLDGGEGNDTYIFSPDSGHDLIYDYDPSRSSRDAIKFTYFTPKNLSRVSLMGQTVKLHFGPSASLMLINQLDPDFRIESFSFANGVIWSHEMLMRQAK